MKKTHYRYMSKGFILRKLPMSARIKARRNFFKQHRQTKEQSLSDNSVGGSTFGHIGSMFIFRYTPEGLDYWINICRTQDV